MIIDIDSVIEGVGGVLESIVKIATSFSENEGSSLVLNVLDCDGNAGVVKIDGVVAIRDCSALDCLQDQSYLTSEAANNSATSLRLEDHYMINSIGGNQLRYDDFVHNIPGNKFIMLQRDSCGNCAYSKPVLEDFFDYLKGEDYPIGITFASANVDEINWWMPGVNGGMLPITILMNGDKVIDSFGGVYQSIDYLTQKCEVFA